MINQNRNCQLLCLLVVFCIFGALDYATAAAIDDIQVSVSTQSCDGFDPSAKSFIVYAKNNNTSQPISATFKYDSNPGGQTFSMWDANVAPYTDIFPKNLEIRIAPSATVPIGCTINYRPSPTPMSVNLVPVTISATGASYVNPSSPNPPSEDPRAFSAFALQTGFSACTGGGRPAGLLYLQNLHPYARLVVSIQLVGGTMGQDLPPLGATRVGCSNGPQSPARILSAKLVYPPGQSVTSKSTGKASKKKGSQALVNPFQQ
jgi:hypothetical protein